MGRKRTTVAKKRVQKCATNKNIAFVVDIIPELKVRNLVHFGTERNLYIFLGS